MNKKILICIALAIVVLFVFLILREQEVITHNRDVISGIFYGESKGYNGNIKLDVVIKNNKITHIEVLEHNETPGFDKVMITLADDIIAKNSLDVDLISGATRTSENFLQAVKKSIEESGISLEDLVPLSENDKPYELENSKKECDILIIGGGGAGFTAAIEALSTEELNVVILEKMPFAGGNTRMSGGEYAAPGNWVQLTEGITMDSKETFFKDIYEGGEKKGNPELIKVLADNALTNANWLRDFVGVKYKDYQSWYGGHSLPRTLWPMGDGAEYIDTLIDKAEELGVDVSYNTRAEELIQDSEGKVIGARAVRGGKVIDYVASKGVILTTGGFGANIEMRMKYDKYWKKLDENIPTTNSPAIVGDGILMASEIGANLVGMEYIQLYPVNNPATGNYYFIDYARINSNALLFNQEGKRFIDEKETRQNLSKAMFNQTGAKAYELIDSRVIGDMGLENLYENELAKCYEQGVLIKGTLEECSEFFNLPIKEVRKTIERYNGFVAQGKDLDFGRKEHLEYIADGPYLMFSCIASVHHTMGGVQIDEFARVIDTNGEVIQGLYAAGEVTGGIHGANRLGSLSIPDTVAFGRIAAQSCILGK